MKKIIRLFLATVIVTTSFAAAFGQLLPESENISPYYIGTSEVVCDITSALGMQLRLYAGLEPKTSASVDDVRITMKVINFVSGGVVQNKTYVAEYNYLTNYYEAKDTCTAITPGSYYLQITYKAYKNGVLLETINQNSTIISIG